MGDCLQTGKPSRYITNTKVNSAFHPFGVSKLNIGLSGWGAFAWVGWRVWTGSYKANSSEMGFP